MASSSLPNARYATRPRWRRWVQCARVVPRAFWTLVRVRRYLRKNETPLPVLLKRLTVAHRQQAASRHRLAPQACLTVARRLVDRGRSHRCLPRALLLYGLLQRSAADDIRFCLGVHPASTRRESAAPSPADALQQESTAPMSAIFAHAWVEVAGTPFGEPTDPYSTHRALYRYPEPLAA